ncbi:ephexin-1-like isoform X4 [Lethenteron reissneri]|uniref:ephexin-1-like isoform X4 n=1 Tax=Lethenteron reissneri TaxID=7753 RepID=UPI002AB70005|nr:ephexin-1-like isoform X4 [Lethenteron reissneri]
MFQLGRPHTEFSGMSGSTLESNNMAVRKLRARFEAMNSVENNFPGRNEQQQQQQQQQQQPVPIPARRKPSIKPKPNMSQIRRNRQGQIRRKSQVNPSELEQSTRTEPAAQDVADAPVDSPRAHQHLHADLHPRALSPLPPLPPPPPAGGRDRVPSNGNAAQGRDLETAGRGQTHEEPEEASEGADEEESDDYEDVRTATPDDDRDSEELQLASDYSEDDQHNPPELPTQEVHRILVRCPALPPKKAGAKLPVPISAKGGDEPSLKIPPGDARRLSLPGLQFPQEIGQSGTKPPVPTPAKSEEPSLQIPRSDSRRFSLPGLQVSDRKSQSEWYYDIMPSDSTENWTDEPSHSQSSSTLECPALPQMQYKPGSPRRSRSPTPTRGKKNYLQTAPLYQDYHRMTLNRKINHQRRLPSSSGTISESEDEFDSDDEYEFPELELGAGESRGRDEERRESVALLQLQQQQQQQRMLWQHLPHVIASGVLASLSGDVKKQQEAMFEVLTSEASYLKSISIVTDVFMTSEELNQTLNMESKKALYSSIADVKKVTESFIAELGDRIDSDILISDICDIVYKYATDDFKVYIPYLTNNRYQEKKFIELRESNSQFSAVVQRLQEMPQCGRLPFTSFLHLPLQRITRLRLLLENILKGREAGSPEEAAAVNAVDALDKVIKESNESVRKMQQVEEMINICQQIVFENVKTIGLVSKNRWLVKQGEVMELTQRGTMIISRHKATPIHMFLFNDMLLLCSKKRDKFVVVDHVHRAMLQVKPNSDTEVANKNSFFLVLLENHAGKHTEKLLQVSSPSDMERWADAICPPKKETDSSEQIYEDWNCPQVQCICEYKASQLDELSLQEADVINVLKKTADDWMEGERLSDGEKGWFPAGCVEEIKNTHVRARNLKERYRLMCVAQRMQKAATEMAGST